MFCSSKFKSAKKFVVFCACTLLIKNVNLQIDLILNKNRFEELIFKLAGNRFSKNQTRAIQVCATTGDVYNFWETNKCKI